MKKRAFLVFGIVFLLIAISFSSVSAIRVGSCVDIEEGVCTPNSPENKCVNYGGLFYTEPIEELAQCEVGCCFYGSNSDITTRARCNALSEVVNTESFFDDNIKDLQTCFEQTAGNEVGACVYEEQGTTICKRATFSECNSLKSSSLVTSAEFSEGYLCTSELLGNLCGPTTQTTCDEDGRIYYLDNCGNKANIFDSKEYNNPLYWDEIIDVDVSCGYGESNADSTSCGNCDYLEGSYCEKAIRGEDNNPNHGDYICKDLSCVYEGSRYEHGEQWCATAEVPYEGSSMDKGILTIAQGGLSRSFSSPSLSSGSSNYEEIDAVWTDMRPGTESYVLKCYYREILTEDCSRGEFRNKVCQEVEINDISNAACQVNIWDSCLDQTQEEKCLDSDSRDCEWVEGYTLLTKRDENGGSLMVDTQGNSVEASCVPKYSPAFEFWTEEEEKQTYYENLCSLSADTCIVEYEFPLWKDRKEMDEANLDDLESRKKYCVKNCQCLEGYEAGDAKEWITATKNPRIKFEQENYNKPWLLNYEDWKFVRDNTCFSLGDCGYSINAFGLNGTNTEKDSIIEEFFRKSKDFREEYGAEE